MLRAGVMLAAAVAGGTASTYLYDRHAPILLRVSAGSCTGLAVVALVGYLAASVFGVGWVSVCVATVASGLPATILASREYRSRLLADLTSAVAACRRFWKQARAAAIARLVLIAFAALVLWQVVDRSMIVRPDGMYTGIRHNFGDLPFHLAAVARFVAGNVPPEHPSFAGVPFTYPFLTDFLSALLVTAGSSLRSAMVVPALMAVFALVVLVYWWTLDLTGDRLAAWLAPVLLLMGGGLGWMIFLQEAFAQRDSLWSFLTHLPHDYTIQERTWRWGNVITTLLVTQRGIQLALPLAVIVFRQWWLADRDVHVAPVATATNLDGSPAAPGDEDIRKNGAANRRMWAAGLVTGLLPLIHGHSYLVVMGMAFCLGWLMGSWRAWARFFGAAVAIGAPAVLWLAFGGSAQGSSFLGWELGWDRRGQNAVVFWLANTGLFIPLILWAVARPGLTKTVRPGVLRFYLPFLLCFLVPNVIRLAPWIWDNIKILIYWFLASVPFVSVALAHWFRGDGWRRALASAVLISLTLAGALDLWRVLSGAAAVEVFSQQAEQFATLVARTTEPGSTVLHAPIHNHPVVLTGRRSLMGHPGHVWTHGINDRLRQREIRRMYRGGPDATALIARYRIDYVVIGPDERRFGVVEAFFSPYEVVGELGSYRLYKVGAREE